jgi:hypothetical protein
MTKIYDVTFKRPEYEAALPRWDLVDDCCAGQKAIKAKKTEYLPRPNPLDLSEEACARYKDYLFRAVFYNATGRTLKGLVGMVFRKDPELKTPATVDYVATDVDGAGVSIYQQSQTTLGGVLKKGRHFLLVDYPQTSGAASIAEMKTNSIRASIVAYPAQCVINWRTEKVGGVHRLSLVVLHEWAESVTPDGFGVEPVEQYRVLRLVGGTYTVEVWRLTEHKAWAAAEGPHSPTDSSGKPWREIPGTFIGAQNNDTGIDEAPLYDLAELNVAHYRNSAEYEDTAFMCGQVQPVMSGVDEHWVEFLKTEGIKIGSRTLFPLPANGTFEFVQAQPNAIPHEAMRHKEEQMVALGAQVLTQGGQARTATEADGDNAESTSVLSIAAANVSEAYTKCLGWLSRFMGATGEVIYTLNQEFVEQRLDAQMLAALVSAWQSGKLPDGDLWTQLRKYGLIDPEKTDDQIREEISTQDPGVDLDEGGGGDGPKPALN